MAPTICVAPTLLQQQDAFASLRRRRHTETSSSLEFEFDFPHAAQQQSQLQSTSPPSTSPTSALILSQLFSNPSPVISSASAYSRLSAAYSSSSSTQMPSCIVVSVSGGQAAGKKTVQAAIAKRLKELSGGKLRIACLSMGDFAKKLNDAEREEARSGVRDMDCIEAYDLDWLVQTTQKIRENPPSSEIKVPKYDILKFQHLPEETTLTSTNELGETGPIDVLIVEGCYLLSEKRLVEMADIKVFVDLNADARLGRRVVRDTEERGIPLDKIFDQYLRFGKRAFEGRIEPAKSRADVILPKGVEGAAIDLIALGIWDDICAKAENVNNFSGGLTAEHERKALLVGKTVGEKQTISIGEVDLERFYDPI
ncbi:Uridine-cytidine kinase-like 1 [Orbilia blumenaviensis]|uniref:Uridine-cytidine kinase-like 1 n=1 Tax=Orbilia blumenaviensis TaxID=1796055 RepID=A0AAV9TWH0_9PEZI